MQGHEKTSVRPFSSRHALQKQPRCRFLLPPKRHSCGCQSVWRGALRLSNYCMQSKAEFWPQVWKDALAEKQQSPYMRHTLAGGVLRDFQFCPYEVFMHMLFVMSLVTTTIYRATFHPHSTLFRTCISSRRRWSFSTVDCGGTGDWVEGFCKLLLLPH